MATARWIALMVSSPFPALTAVSATLAQSRQPRYAPKWPCFLDSSGPGRHKHAPSARSLEFRALCCGLLAPQEPTNRAKEAGPALVRAPESNTRTRTMFAVIRTGGKQYRVAAEDVIQVDKVKGDPGEIVQFGEVLVVGGDNVTLGAPTVAGASVAAEVLEQGRGPKIIAFKKRRRKNSRRKRGHRQEFTLIRVTEILTDGAQPSVTARAKPVPKPAPAEAPASEENDEPAERKAPKAKTKPAPK